MRLKSTLVPMIATLCAAAILPVAGCHSGDESMTAQEVASSSLSAESKATLQKLKADNPAAASLAANAKGVLVFPRVVKGGLVVGGYHGDGALIQNGVATGQFKTTGATAGLQAGLQAFSYAMFFMTDADLKYLDKSDGWEVGVGPTVTVVDKGSAGSLSTTTGRSGVYCIFFDEKGLMAGINVEGSKITRTDR